MIAAGSIGCRAHSSSHADVSPTMCLLGRNALPILALRMMMNTEIAKKNMHEQELMAEVLETLQSLADGESVGEVEIALGPGVDREDAERAWEP
jgi:hypothetical protein